MLTLQVCILRSGSKITSQKVSWPDQVGSGRFITDIEKMVKNKCFLLIVHKIMCCLKSRVGLWKETLEFMLENVKNAGRCNRRYCKQRIVFSSHGYNQLHDLMLQTFLSAYLRHRIYFIVWRKCSRLSQALTSCCHASQVWMKDYL